MSLQRIERFLLASEIEVPSRDNRQNIGIDIQNGHFFWHEVETGKPSTRVDVELDHAVVVDDDFAHVALQKELVDEDRVGHVGRAGEVQIGVARQARSHQQRDDLGVTECAGNDEF